MVKRSIIKNFLKYSFFFTAAHFKCVVRIFSIGRLIVVRGCCLSWPILGPILSNDSTSHALFPNFPHWLTNIIIDRRTTHQMMISCTHQNIHLTNFINFKRITFISVIVYVVISCYHQHSHCQTIPNIYNHRFQTPATAI